MSNLKVVKSKQDHFLFHSLKDGMSNAGLIWVSDMAKKNYGNLTGAGLRNEIVSSVYLNIQLALKDLSSWLIYTKAMEVQKFFC